MASLARLSTVLRRCRTTTPLRPACLTTVQISPPNNDRVRYWSDKKKNHNTPANAGRVTYYQQGGKKSKKGVSLCSGCGCQIISGSSSGMAAGPQAVKEQQLSKKQEKLSRYMDVMDNPKRKALCHRCKALNSGSVWKAYDALRDVSPEVFMDQLKFVVNRRKFGLGIVVVDATDSEHSIVNNLRNAVGKLGLILIWNKVDLLPRFDRGDQRQMERAARKKMNFIASFAVSARTGQGVAEVAEYVCGNLGGRDVFVMGAANVGKSTLVTGLSELIAQSVRLKGRGKKREKRREGVSGLQVTASALPGTTLQALRIPCFPSDRHALWDTPGILSKRALQYHIFPAHLMEPLTRPGRIELPTQENGKIGFIKPGMTLLIESRWMSSEEEEDGTTEECVLARLDLVDLGPPQDHTYYQRHHSIKLQAFLHPSLSIRPVPTEEAPSVATIPPAHIQRIQQKIMSATGEKTSGLQDEYSLPLLPFKHKQGPNGEVRPSEKEQGNNGTYYMDIVFASLGWLSLTSSAEGFTIIPHTVEGSIFSKRRSIYPANLDSLEDSRYLQEEELEGEPDEEETKRRIRDAAKDGKNWSNRNQNQHEYGGDDDEFFDEWY